ncbi:TlpA family protein disulfide reductase [Chitinophaga horti]|uniref:TlpA family protein disulfide reductase n=1 Tax=Chitinophaga horti TaxID=2920382 RepID=A0ABY6J738_9BACT|nr:TlpA disulfide reductase family protein [Chitinophaga horti]UYQ95498.1 TlpA family protein disulfide reductase [Chitinophaga horti]
MKKLMMIGMLSAASYTVAHAQQPAGDTTMRYYSRLVASKDAADHATLESHLYKLLKSDKEKDWLVARNYFYQLGKGKVVDSINAAVKARFPLGMEMLQEEAKKVYAEKDPVKKEALYKALVKKFPPNKPGAESILYDYVRNAVSSAYADVDNVKKAVEYANMIETPIWKGEGWAGAAQRLAARGHKDEALELYKKAQANSFKYLTTHRNEPGAGFAGMGYVGYSTRAAALYIDKKDYANAEKYIKAAFDSSKGVSGDLYSTYAKVLVQQGKDQQAFDLIDAAVRAGQATPGMKESLKTLYPKVKGSAAGYDDYIVAVNKSLAETTRKTLARQMINEPAPAFELKDVDGNTVSLAALKGKVLVLDFWATWCGPCKRSFPSMKMAQDRYKDNPDVKFLFIHTLEQEKNATDSAKAYVTRNGFPFTVLMDLKDDQGKNKVCSDYGVKGIPTKFVIDKEGNIRFRFVGFAGGEDAAVEEVAAMVELAQQPKKS